MQPPSYPFVHRIVSKVDEPHRTLRPEGFSGGGVGGVRSGGGGGGKGEAGVAGEVAGVGALDEAEMTDSDETVSIPPSALTKLSWNAGTRSFTILAFLLINLFR